MGRVNKGQKVMYGYNKYTRDIWNTRSNECCIRFLYMEAKQVHSRRAHQGIKGEF